MNIKLLNLAFVVGFAAALGGCSGEPSPWAKSSSPWDQKRTDKVDAPAAETYKADLEMPAEPEVIAPEANEVELSYQTESIKSFAPEVAVAVEPAEEPVAAEEPVVEETASYMDQPANYYTLQLMASVDVDRVYRFAEQNQVSTDYIVPTVRDGVTWHVLLLGVYADYTSAMAAKDEIMSRLNTEPWIRKVGSVQKLMQ